MGLIVKNPIPIKYEDELSYCTETSVLYHNVVFIKDYDTEDYIIEKGTIVEIDHVNCHAQKNKRNGFLVIEEDELVESLNITIIEARLSFECVPIEYFSKLS